MAERLSSRLTMTYRWIIPWAVLLDVSFMSLLVVLRPDDPRLDLPGPPEDHYWIGPILMIVTIIVLWAFLSWIVFRLHHVELDGRTLRVWNGLRSATVPLADIESVSGLSFTDPKRVTIRFRQATDVGTIITMIPRGMLFRRQRGEPEALARLRTALSQR